MVGGHPYVHLDQGTRSPRHPAKGSIGTGIQDAFRRTLAIARGSFDLTRLDP
jgi:hypothetical protein